MFRLFPSRRKIKSDFLDPDEILADSVSVLETRALEGKLERPIEKFSYAAFLMVVALGILFLGMHAGLLELKDGNSFFEKSQENRFLVRPAFPPRGIMYDVHGKALVENYPSFGLLLEREEFTSASTSIEALIGLLADTLKKPPEYFYEVGLPKDHDPKHLQKLLVLAEGITPDEIVPIASRLNSIRGLTIFENYRRMYPNAYAFSHLLGYVGKLSSGDLEKNPALEQEEHIGKSGVELYYDDILRGRGGKKIIEVDATGKETRFKLVEEPEPGLDVHLTIDEELERVAYATVRGYTKGSRGASVVAVDPLSGAIRALVSFPGFDSNSLGFSLSPKEFEKIIGDPLKPLFNRAISGEFSSGSVIKPMIAAAALEENLVDPNKKIYDPGYIEIPNPYKPGETTRFLDWRKQGWINFYDAIAYSANVYFYIVGGGFQDQKGLGIEKLKRYAERFGLGAKLGIDLAGERSGLIPDPEWKKTADKSNPIWRIGDTYNTSIGQGGVKVTPLQIAMMTSAIVNGGTVWRPYVLDSVTRKDGSLVRKTGPQAIREGVVRKENLAEVMKGMRETVTIGTAHLLQDLPVSAGAKTGTAQAGSGQPHAWVSVFTPAQNPQLVLIVMVEHAGEGSTVAVPITREILNWYYSRTASSTPGVSAR